MDVFFVFQIVNVIFLLKLSDLLSGEQIKVSWTKLFASDLLCVRAGAGRVVGREEHQAVQEQRHLRVWRTEKEL